MKADALIFDLDGTLWNSTEAVAKGWNQGAKKAGLDRAEITTQEIEGVCGKIFIECVETIFEGMDFDYEEVEPYLIEGEREMIEKLGGNLYPGVKEGLEKLRYRYPIYIVSNCQTWYLNAFFNHSGLFDLFHDFETHGATGLSKGENISLIVKRNNLMNPVYIGDTLGDQEAAQFADIPFYFAKYGFGESDRHTKAFENFRELSKFFLEQSLN
jgi:phosphoglycolate phosphatase